MVAGRGSRAKVAVAGPMSRVQSQGRGFKVAGGDNDLREI